MKGKVQKIPVGVSRCLLGEAVRYDGGDRKNPHVTGVLDERFRWVPVCPEVEIGLGIPRPPIRIERRGGELRLVMPEKKIDLTERMTTYARNRVTELADVGIRGFLLKKRSPSCGLAGVDVHGRDRIDPTGTGFFAAALRARFPNMPLAQEDLLDDPIFREAFVLQVQVYDRFQNLREGKPTPKSLQRFHMAHKHLLNHAPRTEQALSRIATLAGGEAFCDLLDTYETMLMAALAGPDGERESPFQRD
ncbi:MAG: DUF1722 domain-containing protein [Deltaproteobacteria bacterium]|nr:MAG: DUF1722 domain-containing protein [Deltaproteobacteria bacterium]